MMRFFVEPEELNDRVIDLRDDNLRHARVLRVKAGEQILVSDGHGTEALCVVQSVSEQAVRLTVSERRSSGTEASVRVSVYMALPKADKLEHVIQKATELGASEIVTFPSARCVSRPDEKSISKKLERWKKIAVSAAEQSGRGEIPDILVLNSYADALERASAADLAMLFYENEHALTLHDALESRPWRTVSLMTGPEGGLEEKEAAQASAAGLQVCTLGRRILRCETAPLCALSAVMYAAGEF